MRWVVGLSSFTPSLTFSSSPPLCVGTAPRAILAKTVANGAFGPVCVRVGGNRPLAHDVTLTNHAANANGRPVRRPHD